jgi:hypothetical protein
VGFIAHDIGFVAYAVGLGTCIRGVAANATTLVADAVCPVVCAGDHGAGSPTSAARTT